MSDFRMGDAVECEYEGVWRSARIVSFRQVQRSPGIYESYAVVTYDEPFKATTGQSIRGAWVRISSRADGLLIRRPMSADAFCSDPACTRERFPHLVHEVLGPNDFLEVGDGFLHHDCRCPDNYADCPVHGPRACCQFNDGYTLCKLPLDAGEHRWPGVKSNYRPGREDDWHYIYHPYQAERTEPVLSPRLVFEGDVMDFRIEDRGQAMIAEIAPDSGDGVFVRVQSWAEDGQHPEFDALISKHHRYRITIERI